MGGQQLGQRPSARLLGRIGALALAVLAWVAMGPASAAAEPRRLALVIGNGDYAAISSLANPVSDSALIAETLRTLGFEAVLVQNADQNAMKRAIADFGRELRAAGPDTVGLFYYAGHGVQDSANVNYLIPTDADIAAEADLPIFAVEAGGVLAQMQSAGNRTNIVILDACRNNPFAAGQRALSRGLAPIDGPTGSFVAFSTAPGSVASDGTGENSPFTMSLAENMMAPGLPIEQMFKQVRVDVLSKTGNAQTPFESSSLVEDFAFNPARADGAAAETALWETVRGTSEVKLVGLFLEAFPDGVHAEDARALLAALDPAGGVMERAEGAATDGIVTQEIPKFVADPGEGRVDFTTPFPAGPPQIVGRSIEDLLRGFPLFTPMQGLDRAMWENQSCSGCHQWTREALCTQSGEIAGRDPAALAGKPHPYGVEFNMALARWARGGCP